jgi:hypothetical protein
MKSANPGNEEMAQRAKSASEQLAMEEKESSTLFVADAGADLAQLRLVYPDRTRYAIVRSEVRSEWLQNRNEKPKLIGYVSGVHTDRIHVPLAYNAIYTSDRAVKPEGWSQQTAPSETAVAFGRRLEPWIIAAAKR